MTERLQTPVRESVDLATVQQRKDHAVKYATFGDTEIDDDILALATDIDRMTEEIQFLRAAVEHYEHRCTCNISERHCCPFVAHTAVAKQL